MAKQRGKHASALPTLTAEEIDGVIDFVGLVVAELGRGEARCREAGRHDPTGTMRANARHYASSASGVRLVIDRLRHVRRARADEEAEVARAC